MTIDLMNTELNRFPIVGVGASAGGLSAFFAFLSGVPVDGDLGMAFVFVQHLTANHKSLLAELIQGKTRLKVFEIEDGMLIEPNCVYVLPAGRDLIYARGRLQLLEPSSPGGHHLPIDLFFKSLAHELHEWAIGIVLSGTGSDGTLGLRAIKAEGGLAIAQNPLSAEQAGMPQSAIATGLVDYELEPAEMIPKLIGYVRHSFGQLAKFNQTSSIKVESAITKIFLLVRAQTGHDFSQYKATTALRRIERRMAVHQIDDISAYVKFLQQSAEEIDAIFHDFLIGVTSFFRDPAAFDTLADTAIPKLLETKPDGATIRAWVAGCSTGEEAYSIAILFLEAFQKIKRNYRLQIFATDLDERAVAVARTGRFPASISANVTPERLERFFTRSADGDSDGYRIRQPVRECIVFSKQDLSRDPPFSKMDFISCRNLLIYLNADIQKKLIPLFHYALNSKGLLFLGTSEGIGEFERLFSVVDRVSKIYQSKDHFVSVRPTTTSQLNFPQTESKTCPTQPIWGCPITERQTVRQIAERALLQNVFMAAALIDAKGDILYLHGRSGSFLEPAPGVPGINNILVMAREGLRSPLITALRKCIEANDLIRQPLVKVKSDKVPIYVNLSICPVSKTGNETRFYLVMLEEALLPQTDATGTRQLILPPVQASSLSPSQTSGEIAEDWQNKSNPELVQVILELKDELLAKEELFQSTKEEMLSSNEELRSSNEEMQSINEELQSSNEELETSKEELQSINEELTTLNAELQAKVADLGQVTSDMNNLIAGTGIGTVFVDHQMRILRFTPTVSAIINLIESDIGRPVCHIVSNLLDYTSMRSDIKGVLDTLLPFDREVQTLEGKWYSMRIRPYRTTENLIEGAVILFIDITDFVQARANLQRANELDRAASVVRDAREAIIVHDFQGQITVWNTGAIRLYGWSEDEALKMRPLDYVPKDLQPKELALLAHAAEGAPLKPYDSERLTKDGKRIPTYIVPCVLIDSDGLPYAIATTERPKTKEK